MNRFSLTLFAAALTAATVLPARGQVRNYLDGDDNVTSAFFTRANATAIISGLNAQGRAPFSLALIPGTAFGREFLSLADPAAARAKLELGDASWQGTGASGFHLIDQSVQGWNGIAGTVSIRSSDSKHGLVVTSYGIGGMAIVGRSLTGAQAVKAVQQVYYTQPALMAYRSGVTSSTDAPAAMVEANGLADLLSLAGNNGAITRIDSDAALHLPSLDDTQAQANSVYFSTSKQRPVYRDTSGFAHPLYDPSPVITPPGTTGNITITAMCGTVRFTPGTQTLQLTNDFVSSRSRFRVLQVQGFSGYAWGGFIYGNHMEIHLSIANDMETEVYWEIVNP